MWANSAAAEENDASHSVQPWERELVCTPRWYFRDDFCVVGGGQAHKRTTATHRSTQCREGVREGGGQGWTGAWREGGLG
jgi:hypothetical protein